MIEDSYIQTIVIKRSANTSDSGGSFTNSTTTIGTIKGCINQLSGSKQTFNQKLNYVSTHRLYCAVTDIKFGDQVTCNGNNYTVNSVNDPMGFGQHLEVDMELVQ